jgi:hypothetical protein
MSNEGIAIQETSRSGLQLSDLKIVGCFEVSFFHFFSSPPKTLRGLYRSMDV